MAQDTAPEQTGDASESLSETEERTLRHFEQMKHSVGESDRGLVLFSAAQLEYYLRIILEAFLIDDKAIASLFDGPYAPLSSLSGKTHAAFAMGLISSAERQRIDAVRKVRNIFAHEIDASFEHEKVKSLCKKPPIFDGLLADRDAFLHMAINTALPLMYRDIRVKAEWKRIEMSAETANKPYP